MLDSPIRLPYSISEAEKIGQFKWVVLIYRNMKENKEMLQDARYASFGATEKEAYRRAESLCDLLYHMSTSFIYLP